MGSFTALPACSVRRLHPISAKGGGYMSVEIKGLDSCVGNYNRWAVSWSRRRKKAWRRPRRPWQTAAKLLCPVDTGYLRESIQTNFAWLPSGEYVGTVGTIVEYAPYVEFGTGRWALRLRPHRRHPLVWVIVRTGKASSHSRTSIPHWSITVTAS